MKTKLLIVLLAVLMLSAVTQAAMRKGPYLIYTGVIDEDTEETEMMVLWQLEDTQECTLEWGEDESCDIGDVVTTEFGDDHQHKYVITGLTTGTKYCYQVTVGGDTYPGSFRTAPAASATAVKLFAWGDSRSRPFTMDDVTGQMINTYTVEDPEFQTICLHSGDITMSDSEADWDNQFFNRDYANNLELQANVPQAFAWGNHEGDGTVWNKYYPYPFVAGYYWSFDYGPVHVVVIDQLSDYTTDSPQHNWLKTDLEGTNKPWKIAVYHKPGWSTIWGHSNNVDVQNYLQPLFVEHNVLLTIAGHNHNYTHCNVDGIHHITSGGGGAPLYMGELTDPYVVAYARALHHCEIDIYIDEYGYNRLNFIARDSTGIVIDEFTIVGDSVAPTPNPMTFATVPHETGHWSIAMTATEATDEFYGVSGVVYYFTCTAGGGHDSGWQNETFYEDTGLTDGTKYTYTVTARDTSVNLNTTAPSKRKFATTDPMDTVTVIKAEYSANNSELKVEATSTAGGDVVLTVNGYDDGVMTYKASKDTHSYSVKPVADPETVTVTSSGGGSGGAEVTYK